MFELLIVDDFLIERENVKDILKQSKLPIEISAECENGEEALNLIDDNKPDFVLTDVEMPYMNGLDLAMEIKRLYPNIITVIFSFYDKFQYVKKAIDNDAFAYILKPLESQEVIMTFEKLIERKEKELSRLKNEIELKNMVEKSKPMLGKIFVKELFEGKHKDTQAIIEKLKYFNIPYDHNMFNIVIIEIENNDQTILDISYEKQELMNLRIDQLLEIYSESNLSMWTRLDSRRWAFLTWFGRVNEEEMQEQIYSVCDLIEEEMNIHQIKTTYAISNTFDKLVDISKAVKQGIFALSCKFNYKEGQIIKYEEVSGIEPEYEIDLGEIQKKVKEVIMSGNEASGICFVQELFDDMGKKIPEDIVRNMCFGIITSMKVVLESQLITFEDILGKETIIWNKLLNFNTIYDVKNWLKNIIAFSIRHINEQKNCSSQKVSDQVKAYIEKNYGKAITIKEIATETFYNPNYLNNAFKKETGSTILEHLTALRIEKAKKMLSEDEKYKIKDISASVGYNNSAYFRNLFKRYTKMSPNEYRMVKRRHLKW